MKYIFIKNGIHGNGFYILTEKENKINFKIVGFDGPDPEQTGVFMYIQHLEEDQIKDIIFGRRFFERVLPLEVAPGENFENTNIRIKIFEFDDETQLELYLAVEYPEYKYMSVKSMAMDVLKTKMQTGGAK